MKNPIKAIREWRDRLFRKKSRGGYYSESHYSKRNNGTITIDILKAIEDAYPDGMRFLSLLKDVDCGDTSKPVFMLDANFAGNGFVAAGGVKPADAVCHEVADILEKRSHVLDVSRVTINGSHENGDFVLQLRFPYNSASEKE